MTSKVNHTLAIGQGQWISATFGWPLASIAAFRTREMMQVGIRGHVRLRAVKHSMCSSFASPKTEYCGLTAQSNLNLFLFTTLEARSYFQEDQGLVRQFRTHDMSTNFYQLRPTALYLTNIGWDVGVLSRV